MRFLKGDDFFVAEATIMRDGIRTVHWLGVTILWLRLGYEMFRAISIETEMSRICFPPICIVLSNAPTKR